MTTTHLDRSDAYSWSFRHVDGEYTYHYQVVFLNEDGSRFIEIHHGTMGDENDTSRAPTMTMSMKEAKQLLRALRSAVEKADRTP